MPPEYFSKKQRLQMSVKSKSFSLFGRNCLSSSKISQIIQSELVLSGNSSGSLIKSSCLVFFATRNLSWDGLQELHQSLAQVIGKKQQLLGCVVDEINGESKGWSITRLSLMQNSDSSFEFFRSAPGVTRRAKSVGRWHLPNHTRTAPSFPPSFTTPTSASENFQSVSLPADLYSASSIPPNIDSLRPSAQSAKSIESIISLSDSEPFDYYSYLHRSFPDSQKMNLIASQTPFLNGSPCTLFYNDHVFSSGCVGVAIVKDVNGTSSDKPPSSISVDFTSNTNLYSISAEPLLITKCRGNIILEVVKGKETENRKKVGTSSILVNQVEKDSKSKASATELKKNSEAGNSKESSESVKKDDIIKENTNIYTKLQNKTGQYAFIPVVGGDLSKGALALDTLMDIESSTETSLEFYRSSMSLNSYSTSRHQVSSKPDALLTFSAALVKEENSIESASGEIHGEMLEGNGNIVVASEQGFLYSTPSTLGGFQVSSIPRSFASLQSSKQK